MSKRDYVIAAELKVLVEETVPKLMEAIKNDKKTDIQVTAARLQLASQALHHLKLLQAAYE